MSLTDYDQINQAATKTEANDSLYCEEEILESNQNAAKLEINSTQKISLSPSKKLR